MRMTWLTVLVFIAFIGTVAAEEDGQYVIVADPYVELHTGPGSTFPITNVIERGEEVEVVKRRTQWFKVRGPRDQEGWAHIDQMEMTLQPSGAEVAFPRSTIAEFRERSWEVGVLAGDFGGATVLSAYGGYGLTKHLSAEIEASQILGDFSDGWSATASLVHTFVPEWRVSPFFLLGTGIIEIDPKATSAEAEDRSDPVGIVGVGFKAYLSERFMFRAEYRNLVVFSSRNDNEDVDEWKAGFAVFF